MQAEVEELMAELRGLGVTLTARRGELTARGPTGAVTDELAQEIRRHKGELIRWLEGIVVWKGTCSVCGVRVKGVGTQGAFSPPEGPVTCLWCMGRITNDTNGNKSDEWGGEEC